MTQWNNATPAAQRRNQRSPYLHWYRHAVSEGQKMGLVERLFRTAAHSESATAKSVSPVCLCFFYFTNQWAKTTTMWLVNVQSCTTKSHVLSFICCSSSAFNSCSFRLEFMGFSGKQTWLLALELKWRLINEVNVALPVSDSILLCPNTSFELQEICSKYTPSRPAPSYCTVGQNNPYSCRNAEIS